MLPTVATFPVRIEIPGVPVAQGRGRAVRFGNSVRVIDPSKSRSWKGAAQVHMLAALRSAGVYTPLDVPLAVEVVAWWPRPKSLPKRVGTEWYWKPSRPDGDNVLKAVMDAGIGVCWTDDSLIVSALVEKRVCGETVTGRMNPTCVAVTIRRVESNLLSLAAVGARGGR